MDIYTTLATLVVIMLSDDEDVALLWYMQRTTKGNFWVYPCITTNADCRTVIAAKELTQDLAKCKELYEVQ